MHNSEDFICSVECSLEDFSKPFDWTDCPPGPEWIVDGLSVLRFMQKIQRENKKVEKVVKMETEEKETMEQNLSRSFMSNCKL